MSDVYLLVFIPNQTLYPLYQRKTEIPTCKELMQIEKEKKKAPAMPEP
jgi:hypothetical protein